MRAKVTADIVVKDRVLKDFETTCEKVGAEALLDVKQDSPLVRAVDRVLQHGLRDPVRGYWSLVRSLTHPTTLKALEAFVKYISSSHQKGLAWTLFTLEEGSLEFYLSSLLLDPGALSRHYLAHGLLRDSGLAQRVISTISSLRAAAATIQASMESSLVSEGPLDCPPSLTSPVDSGVALIDSDSSTSDGEKNEEYKSPGLGPGQAWGPVLGSSVNTEVSTSSDNTIADDNHNSNTIQPTKPSLAPSKYDGVCRRPRKKKKSESGKRVSFHQDSNDDSETSVTLRRPYNVNKFYVEGRNSWAGEGDSYFLAEKNFRQVKSEIYENRAFSSGVSIFESEMGIEADCDSSTTTLDEARNNIEMVCEKLTNVVKQSLGLKTREKSDAVVNINRMRAVEERGVPEGQEDPGPGDCERLQRSLVAVDLTSDSEWSLDTPERFVKRQLFKSPGSVRSASGWPARILQEAPSKTSLVKRFLRSIPTKKVFPEKKERTKPNLYIRGVKPDPGLNGELLRELEEEMKRGAAGRGEGAGGEAEVVTDAMAEALHRTVLRDHETIYKVYRVSSTEGVPLLAVLTDAALYMTGLDTDLTYSRRHLIGYHKLDTVLIGPEYQTLMLVSVDRSVRVTVTVISARGQAMVCELVSHLALAVARHTHSQPGVRQLTLDNMAALRRTLLANTPVTEDEQLRYYRYVRVEDSAVTGGCGPLGPTRCGHLMYRSHDTAPWLPGYVVLKGGVLYVFGDSGQQPPAHILPLHRGYFGGCRRTHSAGRPHAFQVLSAPAAAAFTFAAADDYDASDWLQAFIQTSSTMCSGPAPGAGPLVGCGLLLTSHHLVTLDFPDRVLSCARLQDICAVRTATTCCVLETSCREVQEHGGDWVLYFLTKQATTEFLDTLCRLRPELKQVVSEKWECEALHQHCEQTSRLVRHAWDPLLLPNVKKQ